MKPRTKIEVNTRWPAAIAVTVSMLFGASATEAGLLGQITGAHLDSWGAHAPSGPTVNLYNSAGMVVASNEGVTYGGSFLWSGATYTPAPVPLNFSPLDAPNLLTYCLEINQNIWFGGTFNYDVVSLKDAPTTGAPPAVSGQTPTSMGEDSAKWIEQLWTREFGNIANDSVKAGAFQLAIWKLEYDHKQIASLGSFGLSSFNDGFLQVSNAGNGDVFTLASQWINDVIQNPNTERTGLVALTSAYYQDQVTAIVPPPGPQIQPQAAPEPASVLIWFVAGSFIACSRWRTQRRAARR